MAICVIVYACEYLGVCVSMYFKYQVYDISFVYIDCTHLHICYSFHSHRFCNVRALVRIYAFVTGLHDKTSKALKTSSYEC